VGHVHENDVILERRETEQIRRLVDPGELVATGRRAAQGQKCEEVQGGTASRVRAAG
jgi:hypothetical protein